MTEQQILDLGPALADYLDHFLFCCEYTQTFRHLSVYCRELLSDLKRKTAEPIALASGTGVRTLQPFLTQHGWDYREVSDIFQNRPANLLPELPADDTGTVGVIDESGHAKKGDKTPGVQRQYCGELGKKENCIVTVHLAVARERYKSLIDAELFLPMCWDEDRQRCEEAGIPDYLHHRPKWRIALEQFNRAVANGLHFDWLTFDEAYGAAGEFLAGLGKQLYVGRSPARGVPHSAPGCRAPQPSGRPGPLQPTVQPTTLAGDSPATADAGGASLSTSKRSRRATQGGLDERNLHSENAFGEEDHSRKEGCVSWIIPLPAVPSASTPRSCSAPT